MLKRTHFGIDHILHRLTYCCRHVQCFSHFSCPILPQPNPPFSYLFAPFPAPSSFPMSDKEKFVKTRKNQRVGGKKYCFNSDATLDGSWWYFCNSWIFCYFCNSEISSSRCNVFPSPQVVCMLPKHSKGTPLTGMSFHIWGASSFVCKQPTFSQPQPTWQRQIQTPRPRNPCNNHSEIQLTESVISGFCPLSRCSSSWDSWTSRLLWDKLGDALIRSAPSLTGP